MKQKKLKPKRSLRRFTSANSADVINLKNLDSKIDEEDREIKRLEKLLGLSKKIKDRSKMVTKLNKEYETHDGIGENFGSFLMDLDNLTDSIKRGTSGSQQASEKFDEESVESDSDRDTSASMTDNNLTTTEHDDVIDEELEFDAEELNKPQNGDAHIYRPVQGEDIYGRIINSDNDGVIGSKYIPPAKRKLLTSTIDESSDKVQWLRRAVNGLFNRLSDSSKDSVTLSLQELYQTNSITMTNIIVKDSIFNVIGSSNQIMITLIPIYASVLSALHFTVSKDIGSFIIEHIALQIISSLRRELNPNDSFQPNNGHLHKYIHNKEALNHCLLLVYLYAMRVIDSTIIFDFIEVLLGFKSYSRSDHSLTTDTKDSITTLDTPLTESNTEILSAIITHGGQLLQSDDRGRLKDILLYLAQLLASLKSQDLSVVTESQVQSNQRVIFLLESIVTAFQNKSKRSISLTEYEHIKSLRKWLGNCTHTIVESAYADCCRLGGFKTSSMLRKKVSVNTASLSGDLCLHLTLQDLIDAETRGRWWRAGASWVGTNIKPSSHTDSFHQNQESSAVTSASKSSKHSQSNTNFTNSQETQLLKLAKKMNFHTSIRQQIFCVLMSSHDLQDAYERLERLELKEKSNREIIRVVIDCCGQEESFNLFYPELICYFCKYDRQNKITAQYAIWDNLKILTESSAEIPTRRIVNLARLTACLVCKFVLGLSILKRIDVSTLDENMILFLATFFMAYLTSEMTRDEFEKSLDRVASTQDFAIVRDNILYFMRRYMNEIPTNGFTDEQRKLLSSRKKVVIRTMEAMNVLDIARGYDDTEI